MLGVVENMSRLSRPANAFTFVHPETGVDLTAQALQALQSILPNVQVSMHPYCCAVVLLGQTAALPVPAHMPKHSLLKWHAQI